MCIRDSHCFSSTFSCVYLLYRRSPPLWFFGILGFWKKLLNWKMFAKFGWITKNERHLIVQSPSLLLPWWYLASFASSWVPEKKFQMTNVRETPMNHWELKSERKITLVRANLHGWCKYWSISIQLFDKCILPDPVFHIPTKPTLKYGRAGAYSMGIGSRYLSTLRHFCFVQEKVICLN